MKKPLVNVTIPVYNEAHVLEKNLGRIIEFLRPITDWEFEIVVVDNGSTDRTWQIAQDIARNHGSLVSAIHMDRPGRGGALKHVWTQSRADILSYMDVDLSSDLEAFPSLVRPLVTGEYDLAAGSRLLDGSLTERSWQRQFISCCYNQLVKLLMETQFSDAQCGFKAMTKNAAAVLLPQVKDNHWFMDTELLVKAEKQGFRIFDLAVRWQEDSDSRVRIIRTALQDLKGLVRLRQELQNSRFKLL